MSRRSLFLFFGLGGLLLAFWLSWPAFTVPALAQFTVPSRTPTPPPGGGNGGGGGGGTSNPGGTSDPGGGGGTISTPTSLPASTFAPTPDGGYYPTAGPCGPEPTVRTTSNVNVRLGPGSEYPVVDRLLFLEVRPIIGRAAFGEWWLIRLVNGSEGWVADIVVGVNGYTGLVPLVPAPPLNGATPTPGPTWNPTPNPICTVTPTATSTRTPSPSATPAPGDTPVPATDTPTPSVTPLPSTATATSTSVPEEVEATEEATEIPTAAASPTEAALDTDPGGSGSSLLLYGGVGLVLLGVFGFFVLGRRRDDSTEPVA